MSNEPLNLARGMFTDHLQAAHAIVLHLARSVDHGRPEVDSSDAVTVHAEHMRRVAAGTVYRDPYRQPPRPELHLDGPVPILPDGWAGVVIGREADGEDEVVLCGWDSAGDFWQYAPTETIVSACRAAIEHLIQEAPRG